MNKNKKLSCTTLLKLFPTIEKKHFFPYLTGKGNQINNAPNIATKWYIYTQILY